MLFFFIFTYQQQFTHEIINTQKQTGRDGFTVIRTNNTPTLFHRHACMYTQMHAHKCKHAHTHTHPPPHTEAFLIQTFSLAQPTATAHSYRIRKEKLRTSRGGWRERRQIVRWDRK